MKKFFLAAALLISATFNAQPAKSEVVSFILGATYLALGGGAICGTIDATTGHNVCQGRDNTEWANGFYKTPSFAYPKVAGTPAFDVTQYTPAPAMTAVATNLGALRRAELTAAFSASTSDQYAAAR